MLRQFRKLLLADWTPWRAFDATGPADDDDQRCGDEKTGRADAGDHDPRGHLSKLVYRGVPNLRKGFYS